VEGDPAAKPGGVGGEGGGGGFGGKNPRRKICGFFCFFFPPPPPLPVSPGSPEVDPMIDQNRRSGLRKIGLIKTFSRVYPKKGEHAPGK